MSHDSIHVSEDSALHQSDIVLEQTFKDIMDEAPTPIVGTH